jgi:hypothetical protein
MKTSRLWLGGLALLSFAGCAHQQKAPEPDILALKMSRSCLGRAMHASMMLSGDPEKDKKAAFDNYFEAFLDAKGQQKYVDCLDEDRQDKNYGRNRKEAVKWLKWSQDETAKFKALFPPEKQIADVQEKFTDISDKLGARHVVITLKDGTQTVSDSQFDKTPH